MKKPYQAPLVEEMECKVERGFAGSDATQPQPTGTEQLTQGQEYIFS